MIKHFRNVIFSCYEEAGVKFQNLIHCVALHYRISKGLAKEIIYEMFEKKYIEINLIELVEFGCDGCSADLSKFSKKSCRPRECLLLIKFRDSAVIEAIQDEIRECIISSPYNAVDCIKSAAKRASAANIPAKLIVSAAAELDYSSTLKEAHDRTIAMDDTIEAVIEKIREAEERISEEIKKKEVREILEKLNTAKTDHPEIIRNMLTTKEFAAFTIMKARGEIVYDYTTKTWKLAR